MPSSRTFSHHAFILCIMIYMFWFGYKRNGIIWVIFGFVYGRFLGKYILLGGMVINDFDV